MHIQLSAILTLLSSALALAGSSPPPYQYLPTVDLGYELHQAIAYNTTGQYYNFSNIRYAAPPLDDLRFRAPTSPATDRSVVQTGSDPRICPQAMPAWLQLQGWAKEYLSGENITITQAQFDNLSASAQYAAQPAGAQEDCLFLDVMVPKGIFDKANNTYSYKGAPVMVWIHGGGFTAGWKTVSGNPAGLLARGAAGSREGIIYVSMNYRLGAMGWLAGPTLQSDGDANAGLLDQRFALQWVQKYIHLFGGDPTRVTVFGQSGGAASVIHQITAYGGQQPVPFSRAIPLSPGFRLQFDQQILEAQLQKLFALTNTTCVEDLRNVPSSVLIAMNSLQVFQSPFGEFTYGVAVDNCLVPALPANLLASGKFAKNVQVMGGHNSMEGILFSPILYLADSNYTEAGFTKFLCEDAFPEASQDVRDYIQNKLYPACYTGEYGYTDIVSRLAKLVSEINFDCNSYYLGKAYKGKFYSYYFTIPPAVHGTNVPYIYYNGGGVSSTVLNTTAAILLQDWLTTFAQNGVPTSPDVRGVPKFPKWGSKGMSQQLSLDSVQSILDPSVNSRCAWWQKGLFM